VRVELAVWRLTDAVRRAKLAQGADGIVSYTPRYGRSKAREFDLTQTAKKLAAAIPVFATAIIGVLKTAGVEKATEPAYIAAVLGLTAFGVVALGLVAAADILGRSYVEGAQRIGDATALPGGDDAARERQQLDPAKAPA
jgi:hypothetical protein